ncbi:hypothetical protein Dda_7001 [Drechslerella dactyloides]|uniref:Non-canonical purine NTP phosphatase/PRRC1 domain-containing protein n=1 Tax=Drechslerella dactyloides TaxID=74499 RepID=A0AAD6NFY7_DREDA|nr:hypothetical protein Dda_7001 [Drechslerella dactyloides]
MAMPKTLELMGTSSITGPDTSDSDDKDAKLPSLKCFVPEKSYGNKVLLIIPTANQNKRMLLEDVFRKASVEYKLLLVESAESGVGEQPYNHMGRLGAYNRINDALAQAQLKEDFLEENGIGNIVVASIESYIRYNPASGAVSVDYGYIVIHDATRDGSKPTELISEGVTVPRAYLERAREHGFDDQEKLQGKVTVGRVIANDYNDVSSGNWHKYTAGESGSRYRLLGNALKRLSIEETASGILIGEKIEG